MVVRDTVGVYLVGFGRGMLGRPCYLLGWDVLPIMPKAKHQGGSHMSTHPLNRFAVLRVRMESKALLQTVHCSGGWSTTTKGAQASDVAVKPHRCSHPQRLSTMLDLICGGGSEAWRKGTAHGKVVSHHSFLHTSCQTRAVHVIQSKTLVLSTATHRYGCQMFDACERNNDTPPPPKWCQGLVGA